MGELYYTYLIYLFDESIYRKVILICLLQYIYYGRICNIIRVELSKNWMKFEHRNKKNQYISESE